MATTNETRGKIIKIELPILDEMVEHIGRPESKGMATTELDKAGLQVLADKMVRQLLESEDARKANLSATVLTAVNIQNHQGRVDSTIAVKTPMGANLEFHGELTNGDKNGTVKWAKKPELKMPFLVKTAIAAMGINKQIDEKLADPNVSIGEALAGQMEVRGIELTGMMVGFVENDKFRVTLRGEKITPN